MGLVYPRHYVLWLVYLWINVTVNDVSVIFLSAHKEVDLRSGSQRHRLFVGLSKVPVQHPDHFVNISHDWALYGTMEFVLTILA